MTCYFLQGFWDISTNQLFQKHIRNNPRVTQKQNRSGVYDSSSFYKFPLSLKGNSLLVSEKGTVIAILLKGVITGSAAEAAEEFLHTLMNNHRIRQISNSRGDYLGFMCGLSKESGGKGLVRYHNQFPGFLHSSLALIKQVEDVLQNIDPAFAASSDLIPSQLIPCRPFTAIYCNLTPTLASHVDKRDGKWTAITPLGSFRKGSLQLEYLNTKLKAHRGDMILLHQSSSVYHKVVEAASHRWSYVFSQHPCIIRSYPDHFQ